MVASLRKGMKQKFSMKLFAICYFWPSSQADTVSTSLS